MAIFKHELGARVKMVESDETGTVIGRAEYDDKDTLYLVRYKAGDGRQVEDWWSVKAIEPAITRTA